MGINTLDFDESSYSDEVIPFQFREQKDIENTHGWLKLWFQREYEKAFPRFRMYRRYINMYKNLDEYAGDGMTRESNRNIAPSRRKPKVRDNIIYSYTEQRVAQVSKQKTSLTFVPRVQNDQDDINATKATKLLVRARYEDRNFDGDMIEMDRNTYLLGHTLYETFWDECAGGLAPSYIRAKEKYKEESEVEGVKLDKPTYIGDTEGRLWLPYEFFPEPGRAKFKFCDYVVTFEWKTKQWVEHEWTKAKGKISDSDYVKWDFATDKLDRPNNEIMVRTFWHKPTKYYPEGCKITWCDDMILEWIDFPYKNGKLSFVEEKDIEVKGEFWGRPFISNIEQFYKVNNSLISGMARNHAILNAPKVVAPEGSTDIKSWNNEYSLVQYRGAVEPKILQHNYVNRGEIEFQKYLQSRGGELSSVFDISRGIVPPGITAASAIRYLDEQEHQRATPSISKRKRRVLDITRNEVELMSQEYKDSDERTVRLLGENNEFIIESFNKLALNSVIDVRYENTSSIGDSKSGAIADIIDLNQVTQTDPVFKPKQIIQMLDLGLNDAFKDEATYAIDTARTILDKLLNRKKVVAPSGTDGLPEFYSVFSRFVESITYKTKLSEDVKKAVDDYIMGIETEMWKKSNTNMKFAGILATFEKFPMFFSVPTPPAPVTPPPAAGPMGAPGADTSKMDFQKQNIENQMKEQGAN